jgi:predicted type IV restriction endonuclease
VVLKYQRKKRKRDDQCELDAALEQIPSFGIVSTGRSWVFLKYYKDVEEDTWKLARSVAYHLPLAARIEDRTGLRVAVENLLQVVAGVLHAQREGVKAFEACMSKKRSRTASTA